MGFADDILKFKEKALLAANQSVSNAVESLFTEVVVRSPSPSNPGNYATGQLVNSWFTAVGGTYDMSTTSVTNPYGSDSLSRIKAALSQNLFYGKDNSISLTNSDSMAYRAEYLGWPKTAGTPWKGRVGAYHMVSISVNNFKGAYSQ